MSQVISQHACEEDAKAIKSTFAGNFTWHIYALFQLQRWTNCELKPAVNTEERYLKNILLYELSNTLCF